LTFQTPWEAINLQCGGSLATLSDMREWGRRVWGWPTLRYSWSPRPPSGAPVRQDQVVLARNSTAGRDRSKSGRGLPHLCAKDPSRESAIQECDLGPTADSGSILRAHDRGPDRGWTRIARRKEFDECSFEEGREEKLQEKLQETHEEEHEEGIHAETPSITGSPGAFGPPGSRVG
jgi:hypothetical protein